MVMHFRSKKAYKNWLSAKWGITHESKHHEKVYIGGRVHKVKHKK